jgi:hypothetical protein
VKPRILYVERKAGANEAWIGRVSFSKTGRTLYYRGMSFRSLGGTGIRGNYRELESQEEYWISGCKRDGGDRLFGSRLPVRIDDDVREEYWTVVRRRPAMTSRKRPET